MRKIKLLLAAALSLMAWTGTMAQDTSSAEYQAALEAIQDGATYRIYTNYAGTAYYVTTTGGLTSNKDNAGYFEITKTSGGYFGTGFRISSGSERFTNPPLANSMANLTPGSFAHSTNDRADWERQILYLGSRGTYAIRSCNCQDGTSSWNDAARTHWNCYVVGDVVTPRYDYEPQYIWNFEIPAAIVNVMYKLVEVDGTVIYTSTVKQEANSDVNISKAFPTYNGLLIEDLRYSYAAEGTIGDTDCTIIVTRTKKDSNVEALTDLSNDKAYYIGCQRGAFLTAEGNMISSCLNAAANDAPKGKFAIISYENNYYLYSVTDKKFVQNTGALTGDLISSFNGVEDAIVMTPQDGGLFMLKFNATDKVLNTNSNPPLGYVINDYSTPDPGNMYYIVGADDFDATEAIAALEDYFHPSYTVTYEVCGTDGTVIFRSEPQPTTPGATIAGLPDEFKRPFYTYTAQDAVVEEQETVYGVVATWNGPFEISASFNNAHWYDMAMRSTWYVTSAIEDGDGAYKTQNANTMGLVEDSYQWAFIGNGYDGFKIINKAEGEGKSFGWTDAQQTNAGIPTVMDDAEGHHAWNIVPSTNTTVPAGSFCLNVPGTNLYINQFGGAGGSVKFWNSANNLGDAGSAFTVFDVPSNFASYLVDEGIAAEYDATGYFALTDAAKATLGWDPAYKTDCPFDTYKSLKENLAAAKADLNNFVLPETGFYTLKNKNYGTYLGIDPSDANMYGNYAAANLPKHIVKLTKNADNTYTIGLMGKFAPATVAQSAQVTATAEAGTYTVVIPAFGYAAFQADTENNMSVLHCAGGGSIVGWEAAAAASQWIVEDAESIQLEVGEAGYATAYLPFPATPAGVYDVTVPEALGTWTFDDAANLTAGSGKATLALYGDGVTATDGPDASNGAVSAPVGGGFLLDTHLSEVSSAYTFMFDVSFPDVSGYNCLFQNDVNYKSDPNKDGSFFIKNGQVGFNSAGLGYRGTINTNEWHRIVVVMDDSRCTLYLDGTQIGGPTSAQDVRAWSMKDNKQFLLFVDNDGEEKVTNAAEIRFWAQALTAEEVAKLGAAGYVPQPKQSDMKVYIATLAESASGHSQYLSLDELDGTIPEATPVILKASPEKYVFAVGEKAEETVPDGALKLYDTTVDGGRALAKELAPALEENVLKGTFEPIEAAGKYVLAKPEDKDVCFYKAESGTIAAGKAYLELDSDIKAFFFDFNGEATGINDLKDIKNSQDIIFNIAGQRLNKAQKGINIVNGKKILF